MDALKKAVAVAHRFHRQNVTPHGQRVKLVPHLRILHHKPEFVRQIANDLQLGCYPEPSLRCSLCSVRRFFPVPLCCRVKCVTEGDIEETTDHLVNLRRNGQNLAGDK